MTTASAQTPLSFRREAEDFIAGWNRVMAGSLVVVAMDPEGESQLAVQSELFSQLLGQLST